jgi:carboxyl-terminal processing protease
MKENKEIKNHPTTVKLPILVALTLAGGILVGANFFGGKSRMNNISKGYNKFREVLSLIETSYVDTVNTDTLVDYSIKKMLEKLDPHTLYFTTDETSSARAPLESGYDGVGIEYNFFSDTIHVISVIPGGPSDVAGLRSDDKIIKTDGVPVVGSKITNSFIYSRLRGKRGSEVTIEVLRKGEKKLRMLTIIRDRIPSYSVTGSYMVDPQTGYIKVDRFSENTFDEFKNHLSLLKTSGMKRLVLDLRGNPGGYKDRAEKMVDELVAGEKLIVRTDGKGTQYDSETYTKKEGIFEKGAVIVLMDEGSASAAEIVAGALQDNDRALVVGRRSFGKGLVQMPVNLSDGSELRLTISRYYTPSGRSIQKPYTSGNDEDYEKDYEKRMKSGEFFVADSIKFNEKSKYKTIGGRTVYGGGGITPDVFIPRDTTMITKFLNELWTKNVIREYAFNYSTENRKALEKLTFKDFNKLFVVNETMMIELLKLSKQVGIKGKDNEYARSKPYIRYQIKAYIARNIWQNKFTEGLNNEYFQVMLPLDETLQKSLRYFDRAEKMARGELALEKEISHWGTKGKQ